ncbi:MAG: hypothetical protein P4L55_14200 [Syntrophobacteraceae bacterium]|nr:hypothetical protein [Syntrophobacteraceae bacterium]
MIKKKPLNPQRLRTIRGSFSYIEHRFVRDGFFSALSHHELLLYFLLVLVSDRDGLSFYSYDKLCSLLQMSLDDYLEARDQLIEKDLLAFDGRIFQVLSLPDQPCWAPPPILKTKADMERKDPATVESICRRAFGVKSTADKRHGAQK